MFNQTKLKMTTQEVADRLVSLCREGKFEEVINELYSPEAESIEPAGSVFPEKVKGVSEMIKKGDQWNQMIKEVHSSEISDPLVAENFFSMTMKTKVTLAGMSDPMDMDELCVYEVENGKVISEQFFYTPLTQEA